MQFGRLRGSSLLFADDVVLLVPSVCDLQHSLYWFAAVYGASGMRISTSKSEAMVLRRKLVDSPLRVGTVHDTALFMSEGDLPQNWSSGSGFVLALPALL